MEMKEYIQIIKRNLDLFIVVFAVIVMIIFAYFYFRPEFYTASLTLNISRNGSQETGEFKYDNFYRLQADEKFAETLVQWLRDPRIVSDIFALAGLDINNKSLKELRKSLKAEKLSSQVVSVNFSSTDKKSAEKLASSIENNISRMTEDLNKDQKDITWFQIKAQEPVIIKYRPDFWLILSGAIFTGIFSAFWIILIKHYLR